MKQKLSKAAHISLFLGLILAVVYIWNESSKSDKQRVTFRDLHDLVGGIDFGARRQTQEFIKNSKMVVKPGDILEDSSPEHELIKNNKMVVKPGAGDVPCQTTVPDSESGGPCLFCGLFVCLSVCLTHCMGERSMTIC